MEEKHVYLGIKVTIALLILTFLSGVISIFLNASLFFLLITGFLLLTLLANIITSTLAYQLMARDKMDYGTSLVYGFIVYFLGILGVWFYLKQRAKKLQEEKKPVTETK
ncbi:MAG: hypothetical protein ABID61_00020 [Candidatus Micrarchaeota archaeon]